MQRNLYSYWRKWKPLLEKSFLFFFFFLVNYIDKSREIQKSREKQFFFLDRILRKIITTKISSYFEYNITTSAVNYHMLSTSVSPLTLPTSKHIHFKMSGHRGFRLGSIILHSLWMTIIGIFLILLATANTQKLIYIEIFSVLGVVLATSPWIIQLLVATTIIFLYRIKCYDLTWLVRLPSEEGSCSEGSRGVVDDINNQIWDPNGNGQGRIYGHGGAKVRRYLLIDGRDGPRLERSRTV